MIHNFINTWTPFIAECGIIAMFGFAVLTILTLFIFLLDFVIDKALKVTKAYMGVIEYMRNREDYQNWKNSRG